VDILPGLGVVVVVTTKYKYLYFSSVLIPWIVNLSEILNSKILYMQKSNQVEESKKYKKSKESMRTNELKKVQCSHKTPSEGVGDDDKLKCT
jgi:hypothetical protein